MELGAKMPNQIPAQILRRPQNEDNLKDEDDKRFSHTAMVFSALLSFFYVFPILSSLINLATQTWTCSYRIALQT